jgi:hypothetical protein
MADRFENEFSRLIKLNGMYVIREWKHRVYAHPSGKRFVTSRSPSDMNASRNMLRTLIKFIRLVGGKI